LTKSFEAVLLNPIRDDDPRKRHPDDPIITLSVMYQSVEIEKAIQNALKSKLDKGRAYTADILALHTLRLSPLRDDGTPDLTIPIVHEDEIEEVVSIFLHEHKVLREMFKKFWFLDAYMKEGKQLYRLTV
jgi:hypothetical protein